jgi:hypothetical protein
MLTSCVVLFIGNSGMWEGRVGARQGWFPSSAVKEMTSTGNICTLLNNHKE